MCCTASAIGATRSSRSSRARRRSSTLRQRDRPPWAVGVPRRAEPPVRADGVRHGGRDTAHALHRRRTRGAPFAPVRRWTAERPLALDLHRAPRGAAARPRPRPGDRGPAILAGDHADARFRPEQSAPVHVAHGQLTAGARTLGASLPLVRLPGGVELRGPSTGEVSRALGIGRELERARGGRPARGRRAAPPASAPRSTAPRRGSRRSSSTAPRSAGRPGRRGASRTTSGSRRGSAARSSRAAPSPRRGSSTPALATPYRALSLEPGSARHVVRLEDDHEITARAVVLATGAQYRRLPVDDLSQYEGISVFYAAGPPEAQLCGAERVGVVGGGNSAGQAAVWLARGGALVTLLHRRADLRETMSEYLIHDLERYGVAVRDRSEVAELHGDRRPARCGHADRRRATAVRVPVPLPRGRAVHRLARQRDRARRGRLHPHRRRSGDRQPARDERCRRLRGRRRPLRLDQAMCDGRRRRSDGRAVRPRSSGAGFAFLKRAG